MSHCEDCGGELTVTGTRGMRREVRFVCLTCGHIEIGAPGEHGLTSADEYELAVMAEELHAPVLVE